MALFTRRAAGAEMPLALAQAHNRLCAQPALVGAFFHADITSVTTGDFISKASTPLQVTAAIAADLPTSIALSNQLTGFLRVHMGEGASTDPFACGAHKIPDIANTLTLPSVIVATGVAATDTASVIAALNLIKVSFNLHLAQAGVHYNNDGTNTIAAANAVDLPSSITLANAAKASLNAHILSGPTTPQIKINNT